MLRKTCVAGCLILVLGIAVSTYAQIGPRIGIPLQMTLTLEKPAPDETFSNKKVITLGVQKNTYKFILRDFFISDPEGRVTSADVWEQVSQFRPNFQVRGLNEDAVSNIKPAETVTIMGIYSPVTRTFEVGEVQPGPGPLAPPKSY